MVERYVLQSLRYLRNASRSIDEGNADKAGEFLWGSMAQALKAVAESRVVAGKRLHLRSHRQIWDFVKSLTKELEDKAIYEAFIQANFLHSNFYEAELEMEDVRRLAEEIRIVVDKLLSLASKTAAN